MFQSDHTDHTVLGFLAYVTKTNEYATDVFS